MWKPIAAVIIAMGLSFGAMAEEPACRGSWQEGQAILAEKGSQVVELTQDQREAVQADFNSAEPKTDYVFTHIYTVIMPDAPEGLLLIVLVAGDDCVVEAGAMPRDRLLSIIARHST